MRSKEFGGIRVHKVIEFENMPVSAGEMFMGCTPEMVARGREWLDERFIARGRDEIFLSFHSFVIQSAGRNILVDTCHGNHKQNRTGRMEYYNDLNTDYLGNLARFGLKPEDIDVVLCTHLHFDHVGWNTKLENGRWVPTFPNARYLMSKIDFDNFGKITPDSHDAMHMLSYQDSVLPVVEAGQADFIHFDRCADHDLAKDLWLEPAPGHTHGSVVLHARNDAGGALFSGDVWHHPLQFAEPSLSIFVEQDVPMGLATRKRLIENAVDTNTLIMAAHFPTPTAGRIVSHGSGLRFQFPEE